ncbi:hypothetical protein H2201_005118 [Coniosporium apollinis]|uniref:Uncharacterized protein n=1 Tax=Coniosporium apollinis TaxID=61459 RepID=A0ABQ9NVU8_9PEZI|nr:hypothetical protein H2201_005118 [Coniosporium apollinis]
MAGQEAEKMPAHQQAKEIFHPQKTSLPMLTNHHNAQLRSSCEDEGPKFEIARFADKALALINSFLDSELGRTGRPLGTSSLLPAPLRINKVAVGTQQQEATPTTPTKARRASMDGNLVGAKQSPHKRDDSLASLATQFKWLSVASPRKDPLQGLAAYALLKTTPTQQAKLPNWGFLESTEAMKREEAKSEEHGGRSINGEVEVGSKTYDDPDHHRQSSTATRLRSYEDIPRATVP